VVLASVVILALIAKEVIEVWECTNEDLEEAARKGLQISGSPREFVKTFKCR
jgi:hypothetical protein